MLKLWSEMQQRYDSNNKLWSRMYLSFLHDSPNCPVLSPSAVFVCCLTVRNNGESMKISVESGEFLPKCSQADSAYTSDPSEYMYLLLLGCVTSYERTHPHWLHCHLSCPWTCVMPEYWSFMLSFAGAEWLSLCYYWWPCLRVVKNPT